MSKFERQGAILRLVGAPLATQAELAEALREGIEAVQTTVSRDIAQLGSSRFATRKAGSSTRCRERPTSTVSAR